MFFRVLVPVALLLLRFLFTAAPAFAEAGFLPVAVALAGVARVGEDALWVAFLAADFLLEPDCAVRAGLAAGLLRAVAPVPARLLAVSFVPARELRVVALRRSFWAGAVLVVRVLLVCVWFLPLADADAVPDFLADDFFGDLIAFFATVVAFCAPLSGPCPARR